MAISNVTERLARVSVKHRWAVIAAWLVAVLLSVGAIAGLLGTALTTDDDFTGRPEAQRAEQLLQKAFPPVRADRGFEVDETVIVSSPRLTADDPRFAARLDSLAGELRQAGAAEVRRGPVSQDGHSGLLLVELGRDVEPVVERVAAANGRQGFAALIVGEDSIDEDFSRAADEDLARGEVFGLALALLVLILVFRGVVAAVVPIAVAAASHRGRPGRGRGHRAGVRPELRRRERAGDDGAGRRDRLLAVRRLPLPGGAGGGRRARGRDRGRRLHGEPGGALLRRDGRPRAARDVPRAADDLPLDRRRRDRGRAGRGARRADAAAGDARRPRRPDRADAGAAAAVPAAGRLVAAWPASRSAGRRRAWPPAWRSSSRWRSPSRLDRDRHGGRLDAAGELPDPRRLRGGSRTPSGRRARPRPRSSSRASARPSCGRPWPGSRGRSARTRRTARPSVDVAHGRHRDARDRPGRRGRLRPRRDRGGEGAARAPTCREAFDGRPLRRRWWAASPPTSWTSTEIAADRAPLVFAFVLGLSFLVLVVAFRSIAIPLTAIATNLLSVAAPPTACWCSSSRTGWARDLLGFQAADTIESWLPLFLFTILFGLSMDYHVFLLSRIRERWLATGDTRESVAFGVRTTARLITGAALIMVAVFAGFAERAAGDVPADGVRPRRRGADRRDARAVA